MPAGVTDPSGPAAGFGAALSPPAQTVIDRFPPDKPVHLFGARSGLRSKTEPNAGNGLQKLLDGMEAKRA